MTTATIKALIATGFACLMAAPAAAQKHVALVLDNGGVQAVTPSSTAAPGSHASRIAESLQRMNYRVIFGRQQDQAGMRKYMNDFRGALSDAEVALFYFKGVTLDSSGRNLLMASNAAPGRPIDQSAISLDEIADMMNARQANVLLVDAGLADRTAEALARSGTGLSPTMARLRDRNRFMVAFANMPGKLTRSDAESPFAELLATYLTDNDMTYANLGRKLRQDVFERTRGSQLPWVRSDIGEVRLAALPNPPSPPVLNVPPTPAFDRAALIREVQSELTRHKCYSGSINGNAALAHVGIEALNRTNTGRRSPRLVIASAGPDDFETWLNWIRKYEQPICAPPPAPPVVQQPPRREPRVVTPHREPPRARPSRAPDSDGRGRGLFSGDTHLPPSRGPSGGGGGGNPFAPTR
jgi:hypothetical protein